MATYNNPSSVLDGLGFREEPSGRYTYIDLANGVKLCRTNDLEIATQEKRFYLGENVSDEHVLAMLKGGIITL